MEIILVLLLITLNGLFSMAEIAVISSRRLRLQQKAAKGDKNAKAALALIKNPNRFLSTVQVGISFIGIIIGAFGGAKIAEPLAAQLKPIPVIGNSAETIAIGLVVLAVTYLTLIFGELVPKRLALHNPEFIALLVARPMDFLSRLVSPPVTFLSKSTAFILNLLRISEGDRVSVTLEDVRALLHEGTRVGVLKHMEQDMVEKTLRLGSKTVSALMRPRKEIVWLDIDSSFESIKKVIAKHHYSYYPVCRGTLDKVLGMVITEDVLADYLSDEKIDLWKSLHKPLFVPENANALKLLESFRRSGMHTALVVDEYGLIQGLISLDDVVEEIVGNISAINEVEEKNITKRDANSWFVEGSVTVDEFKNYFRLKKINRDNSDKYNTIGGLVMFRLGRMPRVGDKVVLDNHSLEVIDMDGNRVDKLLVVLA